MMPKLTKIAVGAFLTPYGGMTPYRRRFVASRCFISRDFDGDSLPKVIARPEDKLLSCCDALNLCAHRRCAHGVNDACHDFGFVQAVNRLKSAVLPPLFSALRFLIISEVCLMGDTVNFNQKQPNSLMAIGFKG